MEHLGDHDFTNAITHKGKDLIAVVEAVVDPTVNDDGYNIGTRWLNTASGVEYACFDNSTGAAVWKGAAAWTYIQNASPSTLNIGETWFQPSTEYSFINKNNVWQRQLTEDLLADNTDHSLDANGGYY